MEVTHSDREAQAAWQAVGAAFAALGRAFICLDAEFRVLHASVTLDDILGAGASERVEGRRLADMLGQELFGAAGALRLPLVAGQRREGWRAHLRLDDSEHHLVSVTAAPFPRHLFSACDPRVSYVVVLRPADNEGGPGVGTPTALSGMIARSPAMMRIFSFIENLEQSEATVLITGDSGTGKERVARALHEHSPRREGPFVTVNCGALPSELLESEMYGHVRGAFTGAIRDRVGRFELASTGTLFLDEIGDLPLPLQVKLLRVLQDGSYERLGESAPRTSRARVIAATNTDLRSAVRLRRFRDDLYYRLRVVPIEIPPLRERREDIEPLARATLAKVGARQGRALQLSPDAMRVLLTHDWPGNVRELENTLEYAVAVCRGQTVLPEDLPELARQAPDVETPHAAKPGVPAQPPAALAEDWDVERLRDTLDRHHWRRGDAARALGISRSTLWRRMRNAGLD
jgi:transcriptional regulator with GAF, ATPase, and Fis domain